MSISDINIIQESDLKTFENLTCDSRKVTPKSLFFAMAGVQVNGTDFIPDVIKKGCQHIVIEEKSVGLETLPTDVTYYTSLNIRADYARLNAEFYDANLDHVMAVTGTNGKSSICDYIYQILTYLQIKNASFGTLGLESNVALAVELPKMTTLDAADFQKLQAELVAQDIGYFAFEASSHGLDQYRIDGSKITSAAFTNLSRDHLDYHHDFESYFAAKSRLFRELLDQKGTAVIFVDDLYGQKLTQICKEKGIKVLTYGEDETADCRLVSLSYPSQTESHFQFEFQGQSYHCQTHLISKSQIFNLLGAILLLYSEGISFKDLLSVLSKVHLPKGRLEFLGETTEKASVYIDYAHTPDALLHVLEDLKALPHQKIWTVFGCGGERDVEKRPEMGRIVSQFSDHAIITDDNPRHEAPEKIRQAILKNAPNGIEISSRADAVAYAVRAARSGDIILIAGKGHEVDQDIQGQKIHYSDHETVIEGIKQFDAHDIKIALDYEMPADFYATHLAIDSRKIKPHELFVALKSEANDGEDYIEDALSKGAAAAICSHSFYEQYPSLSASLIPVENPVKAIVKLAEHKRVCSPAKRIAVTGSVGKTTTKELLKLCFEGQAKTVATHGNFNNQLGVPISLCQLSSKDEVGIFEMGMAAAGEISPLSHQVKPDIAIITNIDQVHLEFFESLDGIAKTKAEIFDGMAPGGIAILNRDDVYFNFLSDLAREKKLQICSFGLHDKADIYLSKVTFFSDHTIGEVKISNKTYHLKTMVPGMPTLFNSLAVLGAILHAGFELQKTVDVIATYHPSEMRGEIVPLKLNENTICYLLDESYNANPKAMKAAIHKAALLKEKYGGRALCVLGDMLELGEGALKAHQDLSEDLKEHKIDLFFGFGKLMHALYMKVPKNKKGGYSNKKSDLLKIIIDNLEKNDILLVKGSRGSSIFQVAEDLKSRFGD